MADVYERLLPLPSGTPSLLTFLDLNCILLKLPSNLSFILQVWAYLHLPALGRGNLTRPGLVPIARRWDSRRDTRHLADQLERLQEAIDSYPYLDVSTLNPRLLKLFA